MDLNKSLEFFNPNKVKAPCHVIGCGSIGSNVAELLVRYGIENITIYDFDVVEPHNITNQLYTEFDVGKPKTEALAQLLYSINPALKKKLKIKGAYEPGKNLEGYVFLCVDNVEVRKAIVEGQKNNTFIKAFFDFRTTLTQGQCYLAKAENKEEVESLLNSLDFTHEEALANTPVSACGFELSVAPVVRMTAQMGIVNFTNLINNVETKKLILIEPYKFFFEAM